MRLIVMTNKSFWFELVILIIFTTYIFHLYLQADVNENRIEQS